MRSLHAIWSQVPADYFSNGSKTNFFQKTWHAGKFKALLKIINRNYIQHIADIGSADGSFVHRLCSTIQCKLITAVDPYFPPLQYGKHSFAKIEFLQADAHHIPLQSDSVDVITIFETLEHVVDPYAVLIELKRIIRKNGSIIVEIDSGSLLFQIVWFIWKKIGKGKVWRGAHLTLFNMQTLERLFLEAGLKTKNKMTFNWGMGVCYELQKDSKT